MVKEVKQIKYSDSFLAESAIFEGGARDKAVPIIFAFYLVKTENRVVLVDAGCDTMSGFIMNNYITPDVALLQQDIAPDEVTDIIITHADHDHIDGAHHFKNATVYIQQDEFLRGKCYLDKSFKVVTFENSTVVDDCIKVVKIGGHQKGSCVVEFDFKDKKFVIVGDECYSHYNIKNKIPTASTYCKENSRHFIEKYTNGNYVCLTCHEEESCK